MSNKSEEGIIEEKQPQTKLMKKYFVIFRKKTNYRYLALHSAALSMSSLVKTINARVVTIQIDWDKLSLNTS